MITRATKLSQQRLKTAGHMTFLVRKQRGKCWCLVHFLFILFIHSRAFIHSS